MSLQFVAVFNGLVGCHIAQFLAPGFCLYVLQRLAAGVRIVKMSASPVYGHRDIERPLFTSLQVSLFVKRFRKREPVGY